jgi:hypothetical protein
MLLNIGLLIYTDVCSLPDGLEPSVVDKLLWDTRKVELAD